MKKFERIETGSYRYENGERVYAIELWGDKWQVPALHHRHSRE